MHGIVHQGQARCNKRWSIRASNDRYRDTFSENWYQKSEQRANGTYSRVIRVSISYYLRIVLLTITTAPALTSYICYLELTIYHAFLGYIL